MAHPETRVNPAHLAELDEAREYAAASSYNYLNAELRKLRTAIRSGARVRVEEEAGPIVLRTDGEFVAWARRRYPHADVGG
jgi:hypothetical protein